MLDSMNTPASVEIPEHPYPPALLSGGDSRMEEG